MSSSEIDKIIDYTAAVAARIAGVQSAWGAGLGEVEDPLRPGQPIAAAPSRPTDPYSHWSDCPSAPPVEWVSQNFTVELTWTIPMRLWLPKGDLAEARRAALPFYDRYLRAFTLDWQLGGLVLRSRLTKFAPMGDPDWTWLDMSLTAVERVNYSEP